MHKFKQIASSGLAAGMILTSLATPISASEVAVIDEAYSKPTVVYGGGLNSEEKTQTLSLLGYSNTNSVYEMSVTGDDVLTYLGYQGSTGSLISSVAITKNTSGGVQVNILTQDNITRITSTEYANAAITAGATDVKIDVAAVTKVTGESALTGVYKALEANGEEIDTERTQVAQDELSTTNEIAQSNSSNENFNSEALDSTLVDIKQQLAELKESQGSLATTDQIRNIVEEALKENGLGNILSESDIQKLIDFASKYQNTSAIDSEEVKKQLNELSNNLQNQLSDFLDKAASEGWLDKVVDFFKGIAQSIASLFQ